MKIRVPLVLLLGVGIHCSSGGSFPELGGVREAEAQVNPDQRIRDVLRRTQEILKARERSSPEDAPNVERPSEQPATEGGKADETARGQNLASPEMLSRSDAYDAWYEEHVALRVIVNGSDEGHLSMVLRQLAAMRSKKYLSILEVVIVNPSLKAGYMLDAALDTSEAGARRGKETEFSRNVRALGFYSAAPENSYVARRISEFRRSPVLIIQSKQGIDTLAGTSAFSSVFGSEGELNRGALALAQRDSRIELADLTDPPGASVRVLQVLSDFLEPGASTFDFLPACAKSVSRKQQLGTNVSSDFELLIYDPKDKEQGRRASESSFTAIPYISGAQVNPYFSGNQAIQDMIRMWNIRCLPTRLKATYEPGRLQVQFLEGDFAWQDRVGGQ